MTDTTTETRPAACRNRLRDEGKAYPRSGCAVCKDGGMRGCPYDASRISTILPHSDGAVAAWRGAAEDIAAMPPNDGPTAVHLRTAWEIEQERRSRKTASPINPVPTGPTPTNDQEAAFKAAHVGRHVETPGLLDSFECSCGWKSDGFFDGAEYARSQWKKHVASAALILRQAPDAGGEPVAWRVRFDLGYNDEWAVTTVKPPPGSIEAGYAQPLYLAPDAIKGPTDA